MSRHTYSTILSSQWYVSGGELDTYRPVLDIDSVLTLSQLLLRYTADNVWITNRSNIAYNIGTFREQCRLLLRTMNFEEKSTDDRQNL